MNWITKIYKHHKEWVAMVVSLGGGMYSEDIVSEAYIKLDKYNCEHKIIRKGKVSKGYMYFVLRSIFINYIKAKNKIRTIQIEKFFKDSDFMEIKDLEKFTIRDTITEEIAFGRLCNKMDLVVNGWHWYDKKIFELYRDTPLSIRGMAKETDISSVNIFHTLKKGKNIMNQKFAEDYEDFKNGDFDLI